jgi:hypothetical protein
VEAFEVLAPLSFFAVMHLTVHERGFAEQYCSGRWLTAMPCTQKHGVAALCDNDRNLIEYGLLIPSSANAKLFSIRRSVIWPNRLVVGTFRLRARLPKAYHGMPKSRILLLEE